MIAHINGKVDTEMLDKFIQLFNNNADEYTIYFSSTGGSLEDANVIIDLINKNANKVTLIAYFSILSAGFDIFFKTKCKKEILSTAIGMYHLGVVEIDMSVNGKVAYHSGVAQMKDNVKNQYPKALEFCKSLGFNDTELRKIKKGDDVYFIYDRLIEFMNNQITQDNEI